MYAFSFWKYTDIYLLFWYALSYELFSFTCRNLYTCRLQEQFERNINWNVAAMPLHVMIKNHND